MVLGLGEGSIEVTTDKQSYSSGEKISGQLTLSLNSPKKAKELRVMFYGVIRSGKHTRTEFPQQVVLDSEKEYPAGPRIYNFELQLPAVQTNRIEGEGISAAVGNLFLGMFNPYAHARWYLDASLNVPMAFDINKKIPLNFRV